MCNMPCTHIAFNTELRLTENGQVPTWIELLPAANTQNKIIGRDGRSWIWDAAAQRDVLNAFNRRDLDIALDWEHASIHRAANGEEAPAAGWIDQLDIRDGALYGRVAWTPRGREQVQNREYRYVSPVFDYQPQTARIAQVLSVGLTNLPNLHLTALNAEGAISPTEDNSMSRTAELAAGIAALGLPADADDAAIATAINTMKTERDAAKATALNAEQSPPLERYVPRADYDAVMARAANAEKTLRERDQAAHTAAVEAEIEAAVKAGKIAPVSVEYYRAQCREEKGLAAFKAFISTAPVIGGDSGLDEKKPPTTATALNSDEAAAQARAYIAEQKKAGIELSYADAVHHIYKRASA